MPFTAVEAIRLLRTSLAKDAYTLNTDTKVGLCTSATVPTATTSGTPITGDPRVGPTAWSAGATGGGVSSIQNVGAFSFTNMPAVPSPGVRYIDIYDSAGTPNRKAYGQLAADRITAAGDQLTFADGALQVGLVTSIGSTAST